MYFEDNAFYHVLRYKKLDNPGQRICNDMDNWTYGAISFSLRIIQQIMAMFAWTFVLLHVASHLVPVVFGGSVIVVLGSVLIFLSKITAIHVFISKVNLRHCFKVFLCFFFFPTNILLATLFSRYATERFESAQIRNKIH